MTVDHVNLDKLAVACEKIDVDTLNASARQLGFGFTEQGLAELHHALENTNTHQTYEGTERQFGLADALSVLSDAATNEGGIAVLEVNRQYRIGKEVAVAVRTDTHVHLGVRYASNLPMNPGTLWPDLKPWHKALPRNRKRLAKWLQNSSNGLVTFDLARRQKGFPERGEELLAAVIADPEDRETRLVYADWLVECGDAQGTLIQLCESLESVQDEGAERIRNEIKTLEEQFGQRISGEAAQHASQVWLRNGFVDSVEMKAATYAKHAERLMGRHPVRELRLKPCDTAALKRLAKAPALGLLRALRLSQRIGGERPTPFGDLCASPHLDSLREIQVWTWVSEGDVAAAFGAMNAPQLSRVLLYSVDSTGEIVAGLADNTSMKLRSLTITSGLFQRFPEETGHCMRGLRHLEALRISERGALNGAFAQGGHPTLTKVHFEPNDDAVVAFAASAWPQLKELELSPDFDEPITNRGIEAILTSKSLPQLAALRIALCDKLNVAALIELMLSLPDDHSLKAVSIPTAGVGADLLTRLSARFADYDGPDVD